MVNGLNLNNKQELISPYSEEKIAEIPQASEELVDAATSAANNTR